MQGEVVQELLGLARARAYFSGVDRNGIEWEVDDEFAEPLALDAIIIVAPLERCSRRTRPSTRCYVIQRGLVGCQTRVLRKGEAFGDDVFVYYLPPSTPPSAREPGRVRGRTRADRTGAGTEPPR